MTSIHKRVAARYLIRCAAREVARERRAARMVASGLSADVLAAFGEASVDGVASGRMTVAGVASRMRELVTLFTRAPEAWEQLKRVIGASSLLDLPGKVSELVKGAAAHLRAAGESLARSVPVLQIYLEVGTRLPAVGEWLSTMYDKLPGPVRAAVSRITSKVKSLAQWLDELVGKNDVAKLVGRAASAAIFAYVWMNVAELSWDLPGILRGFSGQLSFSELVETLPESGLGLLVSLLFPGIPQKLVFNAFLPITVALRLAYLYERKLIKINGKKVSLTLGGQTYEF